MIKPSRIIRTLRKLAYLVPNAVENEEKKYFNCNISLRFGCVAPPTKNRYSPSMTSRYDD